MKILRPCPDCGRDESAGAQTCSSCGRALTAWASEPDPTPVRSAKLGTGTRRAMTLVAVVVLAVLGLWALFAWLQRPSSEPRPSWRRPDSVAAWATERLAARGAAPRAITAFVESRTEQPRRLLLSSHEPALDDREAVRAAAEVLLAARAEGERLSTHAAILELGVDGARRSVLVPTMDADRLLSDDEALDRLLQGALPGPLPVLEGVAPPPPPSVTADEASATGAIAEGSGDEPAGPEPAGPDREGRPPGSASARTGDDEPAGEPTPAPTSAAGPAAAAGGPPRPPVSQSKPGEPDEEEERTVAGTPMEATDAPAPATRSLPVSLHRGPGSRPSHSYEAGEKGVILLRFSLHPVRRRALMLRSVTVQARGTLDDADGVDFVHLVQDLNRNGLRDDSDRQVGELQAFVDDDGSVTFSDLDLAFGGDGQALQMLVVVDFLDGTEGGSIMLMLPGEDALGIEEVASGELLQVNGAPLNGFMTTLDGDLESDAAQEALDRLADEQP